MKPISVMALAGLFVILFIQVQAGPKTPVDWCNTDSPATLTLNGGETFSVLGQVYLKNVTTRTGRGVGIIGAVGYGQAGTHPTDLSWVWRNASYLSDADGATPGDHARDLYTGNLTAPLTGGSYDFCCRFRYHGGPFTYGDLDGSDNGYTPSVAGKLNVVGGTPTPSPTPYPNMVDWCALQWPPQAVLPPGELFDVYGNVFEAGVTEAVGQGLGIEGEVGIGPDATLPDTDANWVWYPATFLMDTGNYDGYWAQIPAPATPATYDYCYRFRIDGGPWLYADYDGTQNGYSTDQAGDLTVYLPTPSPTPWPSPTSPPETVDWCILQWPLQATLSPGDSFTVFGYVFEAGVTDSAGQGSGIEAQVGIGPQASNPDGNSSWVWTPADYSGDFGQNDGYQTLTPAPVAPGTYDFCYRFRYQSGPWIYADFDGSSNGYSPDQAGVLTVLEMTPTPTLTPEPSPTSEPGQVDWCNLQWPPRAALVAGDSFLAMGLVYKAGVTNEIGQGAGIEAQAGIGADATSPDSDPSWTWTDASFSRDIGDNDEYSVALTAPLVPGEYDFCFRYRYDGGAWKYGDYDGSTNGYSPDQAGILSVMAPPTPSPTPTATETPAPSPSPTEVSNTVDWGNLQWPPRISLITGESFEVLGQAYKEGVTPGAGAGVGIEAQAGIGLHATDPETELSWAWTAATYQRDAGNNDEFSAILTAPDVAGDYDYCYRFRYNGGLWTYGDYDGSGNGYSTDQAGQLTVRIYVAPSPTPTPSPSPTMDPNAIDWCMLGLPDQIVAQPGELFEVFAQVYKVGVTEANGQGPGIEAEMGLGPDGSFPETDASWTWLPAAYNMDIGVTDEYSLSVSAPTTPGKYDYCFRFRYNSGPWAYADLDNSYNGYAPLFAGDLIVEGVVPTPSATPTPTLTPTPPPTATPGPSIDTDGDGYADWYETQQGFDPSHPNSHPSLGDVNGDGIVNVMDALILYRMIRGQLPPEAGRLEDVTYDGQCTVEDAIILYRWCTRASGFEILPRL